MHVGRSCLCSFCRSLPAYLHFKLLSVPLVCSAAVQELLSCLVYAMRLPCRRWSCVATLLTKSGASPSSQQPDPCCPPSLPTNSQASYQHLRRSACARASPGYAPSSQRALHAAYEPYNTPHGRSCSSVQQISSCDLMQRGSGRCTQHVRQHCRAWSRGRLRSWQQQQRSSG
jgi:hypothetical protein